MAGVFGQAVLKKSNGGMKLKGSEEMPRMNCPTCGRFMVLSYNEDLKRHEYWCLNSLCLFYDECIVPRTLPKRAKELGFRSKMIWDEINRINKIPEPEVFDC